MPTNTSVAQNPSGYLTCAGLGDDKKEEKRDSAEGRIKLKEPKDNDFTHAQVPTKCIKYVTYSCYHNI